MDVVHVEAELRARSAVSRPRRGRHHQRAPVANAISDALSQLSIEITEIGDAERIFRLVEEARRP